MTVSQKYVLGLAVLLVAWGTPALADLNHWTEGMGGNGHWYELIYTVSDPTFEELRADAIARGGYLATVTSPEENSFLAGLLPNPGTGEFACLGGVNDGGWSWVTGETWSYTNWLQDEPYPWGGVTYARMYFSTDPSRNGKWHATKDNDLNWFYIVEYNVPEPTTLSLLLVGGIVALRRRR